MPVRYIGREGSHKGKFLFDILCNLRGFGVGRMVVRRTQLETYSEPSYYIIKQSLPDLWKEEVKSGKIVAKQVFRGKLLSESKVVSSSYTPDWALVPKDEEYKYLSDDRVYSGEEVPTICDMPPLLSLLYSDMIQREGHQVQPEDSKLLLRIKRSPHNFAKQTALDKILETLPEEARQRYAPQQEFYLPKNRTKRNYVIQKIREGKISFTKSAASTQSAEAL